MLAKRLALIEPLLFTVLFVVLFVSPILLTNPVASAPSKIMFIALLLGWNAAVLAVCARARPEAEPSAKVLLWLALALGVVLVANTLLLTFGKSGGPSLFIAFGLYLLFVWRVARALEYAAAQDDKPVTYGQIASTFFMLWISVVGVWLLKSKIAAVAERA